jgi:histidinol phosphatase-like enzyme (inositol monophosphatase family)
MSINDLTVNPSPFKERLRAAHQWGLEAGYLTLGYFDLTLKKRSSASTPDGEDHYRIERKADQTFVTTADREAESLLRSRILAAFPEDSIVGEEFGSQKGANHWTWYLDPIDGTQAFVHGVPLFGTLIGIEYEGVSVAGVIVLPALGESIYAGKNLGCFWQRGFIKDEVMKSFVGGMTTKAQVSEVSTLKEALFCTTWMQSFKATQTLDLFYKLCDEIGVFRGWGDCYGYALVATGRAEIMVDPQLMVWDAAPMLVILEEAGGKYTDFSGEESIHSGSGFATNGLLHQSVLTILKGGSLTP